MYINITEYLLINVLLKNLFHKNNRYKIMQNNSSQKVVKNVLNNCQNQESFECYLVSDD